MLTTLLVVGIMVFILAAVLAPTSAKGIQLDLETEEKEIAPPRTAKLNGMVPKDLKEIKQLFTDYDTYLGSIAWYEKASSIKKRDHYRCMMCNCTARLEVHHLTYARLYNEKDSDLVSVCGDCHQLIHDTAGPNALYYPLVSLESRS